MTHLPQRAPSPRRATPRALVVALGLAATGAPLSAQAIDDGIMLSRRMARTTVEYGHESWDRYWEGDFKRTNENIGTLTTRTVTWMGSYGVTERLSVFATLPYVWTSASQGVLHEMQGRQDLTVAAKYRVLHSSVAGRARLDATVAAGVGAPTSNYTPDFLPMSIGLGSRRALARAAVHVADRTGWFADGGVGHTWRSTVKLDRPAYYTDGELVLSNEVAMPDVVDYGVGVGFQNATWCIPLMLAGQRTLGGGDIRRQDMPFVSNRMDFVRVQGKVMYMVPQLPGLGVLVGGMRTLAGRNVGQSSMYSVGLISAFRL